MSKKTKLIGIAIILYFLGSVALAIYFGLSNEPGLALLDIGLLFTLASAGAVITDMRQIKTVWILFLAGLALIFLGMHFKFPGLIPPAFNPSKSIIFVVIIIFFIANIIYAMPRIISYVKSKIPK